MACIDETGSKVFFFVHIMKHAEGNIPDRGEEEVKKGTVFKKKDSFP